MNLWQKPERGEMMARSYVKFETPKELQSKVLEAISVASDTGRVRKGANEATKAIEAGNAEFVVMAEDVDPEEVVMHLPLLCAEKNVPFCYVATKKELGTAAGIPVACSAVAIEKAGNAAELVRDIIEKLAKMGKYEPKKEAPKQQPSEVVEQKADEGEQAPKKKGRAKKKE